MLASSKLFCFLDDRTDFGIYFFEGQKIISDYALLHNLNGEKLFFFRDMLLSFGHLMAFIKPQETLGLYVDSTAPRFSFKLEANGKGKMRSVIVSDDHSKNFETKEATIRLTKIMPEKAPYNSILNIQNLNPEEISNTILKNSYQIDSYVRNSDSVDQSIMVTKIPDNSYNQKLVNRPKSSKEFLIQHNKDINQLLKTNFNDDQAIISYFKDLGINHINTTVVEMSCSCNRERFLSYLTSIKNSNPKDLANTENNTIQVTCDYCKKQYEFKLDELIYWS